MRIFVAGGTGELGAVTVGLLVDAGHAVTATARGPEKAELVRSLGAEPVNVDLFDVAAMREVIRGSDAVLRLTTSIPPIAKMRRRASWNANNRLRTEGARALVDAVLAEGIRRYISESVTFVYAAAGDDWVDEDRAVDGTGLPVIEAALRSEAEAARVTDAGGAGVVLRFGSFYSASSPQTVALADLAGKRMFPVVGRGDNFFSSIAVNDAAAAVVASLALPAGVYNVVDDEPLRYRDYVQAYTDAVGGPKPLRVPRRVGATAIGSHIAAYLLRSQRVSNRKLKASSAWRPSHADLRAGLAAIPLSLPAQ